MGKVFIRVTNPTLRFWNWIKIECKIMAPGSEKFDEQQTLTQIDVDITDTLKEGVSSDELVAAWQENPHFHNGTQSYEVMVSDVHNVFEITGIFESDGKTPKEDAQHRVGRKVHSVLPLQIGLPMRLMNLVGDGHGIRTTRIQGISAKGQSLIIQTSNSVYHLQSRAA